MSTTDGKKKFRASAKSGRIRKKIHFITETEKKNYFKNSYQDPPSPKVLTVLRRYRQSGDTEAIMIFQQKM
jgi:hypothetical protein